MPLFCPYCSTLDDDDAPYCSRCGHDLVPTDRRLQQKDVPVAVARRGEVVVRGCRVNCVCYGEQLRYDPVTEAMASMFRCGRYPERIECAACPVCSVCGESRCVCGLLGIRINVKTKGTVIETVPSRDR